MINPIETMKDGFGAIKFWGSKNAPIIFTTVGCIGVVVGTVTACIQTTKIDSITARRDDELADLDLDLKMGHITEKEYRNGLRKTYICWALRMGKNYALPAFIEIGGLFCIGYGQAKALSRCAAATALLTEALQRNKKLEDFIHDNMGEEGLTRAIAGEGVTITEMPPGCEKPTSYKKYFDDQTEFDFVWTVGNGEYSKNDPVLNERVRRDTQTWANRCQRGYWDMCHLNDIYRRYELFDKVRTEHDKSAMGWPSVKCGHDYEVIIEHRPLPGTERPEEGKTEPDYLVHFVNPPIPCRDIQIEAGFCAS